MRLELKIVVDVPENTDIEIATIQARMDIKEAIRNMENMDEDFLLSFVSVE